MTRLVAAGLSFRTAPLAVREAAAVTPEHARTLLRYLVGHAGFSGAAVMSTCNRTEFYVTVDDGAAGDVAARLAPHLDPDDTHEVVRHLRTWQDSDAVDHLFRVAAGLESMVVGEAQVLGQLKDAHEMARESASLDAELDFVLRRAISVGKLVRTVTDLGRGANLSDVAVSCARDVVGDLRGKGVLLVGAGTMSELAARRLRRVGANIAVTSRGDSKDRLAESVTGRAVALDRLVDIAADIDVMLCSTASGEPVISAALVGALQEAREGRQLCIVDIAVPRDVEPDAGSIDGVSLIDIDAVGKRLDARRAAQQNWIPSAERVIATELQRTMRVIGQRSAAGPTITSLIRRAEAIRRREVERAVARAPELDATARERIDTLTGSLVRKLLHGPIAHLRESADDPSVALTLRRAFHLHEEPEVERAGTPSRGIAQATDR